MVVMRSRGLFRILLVQFRVDPVIREHELYEVAKSACVSLSQIDTVNALLPISDDEVFDSADLVILGGSGEYSVFDEMAGLDTVTVWLNKAFIENKPVLGLCLGAQYLAHLFGGKVVTSPSREELGSQAIQLSEQGKTHQLFSSYPDEFIAQVGHQQTIVEVPESAEILALTEKAIHTFYWPGTAIYGFQFHPELTKEGMIFRVMYYQSKYAPSSVECNNIINNAKESIYTNGFIAKFIDYIKNATCYAS
jgi:GMP synthase-like glutamine amidotransferase